MLRITLSLAIMMLVACADPSSARGSSAGSAETQDRCTAWRAVNAPCHLPIQAIISSPEAFLGERVTFMGFLGGEGVPGVVFATREHWAIHDTASAVRLTIQLDDLEAWAERSPGTKHSYVYVVGTVVGLGEGRQPNIHLEVSEIVAMREAENLTRLETEKIAEESRADTGR